MTNYTKPVCRGSLSLGTACGICERCDTERALIAARPYPEPEAWMLAQTIEEPAKSYEDGIRACIDALPRDARFAIAALEALLPQHDPAKALVDEFWSSDDRWKGWRTPGREEATEAFARWIIAQGWRKG